MIDVERVLRDLEQAPVPSRLSLIDDAVLQALADIESERRALGARPMAVAAIAALIFGIAGAALPGTAARAAPTAPLGGDLSLAPSTLLDSSR
jgi:hypothetical protein